jgi:hypothetical protein
VLVWSEGCKGLFVSGRRRRWQRRSADQGQRFLHMHSIS